MKNQTFMGKTCFDDITGQKERKKVSSVSLDGAHDEALPYFGNFSFGHFLLKQPLFLGKVLVRYLRIFSRTVS